MNHADRQRLSQLLDDMDRIINHEWSTIDEVMEPLTEARAIVDGAPTIITNEHVPPNTVIIGSFDSYREPPNPKLDAFLTEPIHEYQPPAAYGLRINRGNRRRHRALSPFRTALVLTLACICLAALAASIAPRTLTDRPPNPDRPPEGPSEAAQSHIRVQPEPQITILTPIRPR